VSYVLNGKPDSRISPSTRARVEAAAADLGYTPHAVARSLRTGRSNLILLPQPPFPPGALLDAFIELVQARSATSATWSRCTATAADSTSKRPGCGPPCARRAQSSGPNQSRRRPSRCCAVPALVPF